MSLHRRLLSRAALVAALLSATVVPATDSSAAPPKVGAASADPAARGLDVFLVGPSWGVPGARLSFVARAIGYRTVTGGAPLAGAKISMAWDATEVPDAAPVVATADASGRATLALVMPAVRDTAHLLVTIESGTHSRTRTFEVAPRADREVEVAVSDSAVVPGTQVGAWVRVRDRAGGRRVDGAPVLVEMVDGGIVRDRVRTVTDSTGSALVTLRVPDLPTGWKPDWILRATLVESAVSGAVDLHPREEVVDQPWMTAAWDQRTGFAGSSVRARIRLRDASGEAIAGEKIEWVVTPVDPDQNKEEDWERQKVGVTDVDGMIAIETTAPAVAPGGRLRLRLSVRTTESFARALTQTAELEVVAQGASSLEVIPEGKTLVPGVSQRIFVRAHGDDGRPIEGPAHVSGDGLDVDVKLDARGEAEVAWTPPVDVGSRRDVGGCARSIAASVTLTERSGRLAKRGQRIFDCVVVDRAREARLEVDPPVARAGQKVRVRVVAREKGAAKRPFALDLAPRAGGGTPQALWIEDGEAGADVVLPEGPSSTWNVVAHAPRDGQAALQAAATILVLPTTLPKASAKIVGGRIAPSGHVDVEVRLTDDTGKPIDGLVAGLVYDAFGGGDAGEIKRLDSHVRLCEAAGLEPARCDDMWKGDAASTALARSGMGSFVARGTPLGDPGGSARADLETAFNETLRSLEGAVFEATSSPDRLLDARRDRGGARSFNPELFRIVTEALSTPPTTPGGEPLELADLTAVDAQVKFDVVARRVTRLKVFRVLSAVRQYRLDKNLDLSEPALADPNLLLGLMTTRGDLDEAALLDPWGGTIAFRKGGGGKTAPGIASLPGWELASPGPDGRAGSGDDVVDPFERVVKSGTPYARALDEDAIVLARADMRVHDATIAGWSSLLEEKTGTHLGNAGTGSGSGRLGGSHRTKPPSVRMGATSVDRRPREPVWSLPVRTGNGVARLRLPLGEVDTTYRVIVAGLSDGGEAAITDLDIPVTTPIAARIETGTKWTTGDTVEVSARIRNRTATPAALVASFRGSGPVSVAAATRTNVTVPARGSETVRVRVKAARAGEGVIELRLADSTGKEIDAVRAAVPIVDPGRPVVRSRSRFVAGDAEIPMIELGADERSAGRPRVVVEGGAREALLGALESLEPDRQTTGEALADAIEAATRIELFAREDGDAPDQLRARAKSAQERGVGRLRSLRIETKVPEMRRAMAFATFPNTTAAAPPCGDGTTDPDQAKTIALLESEPSEALGATSSCWDSVSESVKRGVLEDDDPVALARLVSAFSERANHRADAMLLAEKLAGKVSLDAAGRIVLGGSHAGRRDSRAVVYAGLLRGAAAGAKLVAPREALLGWLLVQRDARGGFGSPLATRLAVAAVVASAPRRPVDRSAPVVTLQAFDDDDELGNALRFEVSPTATRRSRAVDLDPKTSAVRVAAPVSGALVRLERRVMVVGRPSNEVFASPLRLELTWPNDARAGKTSKLEIRLRTTGKETLKTRVVLPLPPGVSLAESVSGVRMIPGGLVIDLTAELDADPVPLRLPLRFALAGDMAVPEASATTSETAGEEIFAASPRLVVRR